MTTLKRRLKRLEKEQRFKDWLGYERFLEGLTEEQLEAVAAHWRFPEPSLSNPSCQFLSSSCSILLLSVAIALLPSPLKRCQTTLQIGNLNSAQESGSQIADRIGQLGVQFSDSYLND